YVFMRSIKGVRMSCQNKFIQMVLFKIHLRHIRQGYGSMIRMKGSITIVCLTGLKRHKFWSEVNSMPYVLPTYAERIVYMKTAITRLHVMLFNYRLMIH